MEEGNVCLRISVFTLCMLFELFARGMCSEFYADNGLQQTIIIGKNNKRKSEEVQQEILTLLGLHQRPKVVKHGVHNSAPKYMIQLYNTLQKETGEGITDETAFITKVDLTFGKTIQHINGTDVIRSFVNHADKVPHLRHDKDCTFFFDTSDVSPSEIVMGAEFRMYKEANRSRGFECLIEVFRITQGKDPEDKTLVLEANKTLSWDYEGWISFNVSQTVDLWTHLLLPNLGLYVRVTNLARGRVIDPGKFGIVGRRGADEKQAFMVGFFKMSREMYVRVRRSVHKKPNSTPNEAENYYYWGGDSYSVARYRQSACQRHTLYVSFRSLGWQDWIIAPEGYAAFYCGGECTFPLGAHMNATNHAIVQTLVHLTKPSQVPKPCCAPTKLSAIQVLYFDEKSNVVLKRYKNMKVKACGCH